MSISRYIVSFQLSLKEAQAVARTLDVQLLVVDAPPDDTNQPLPT
jgi:hypothetical protein